MERMPSRKSQQTLYDGMGPSYHNWIESTWRRVVANPDTAVQKHFSNSNHINSSSKLLIVRIGYTAVRWTDS